MQKQIKICWHNHADLADTLKEDFIKRGIKATASDKCLCQLIEEKIQELVVLLYPGNDENCYSSCRNIIQKNPDTQFYIMRFNTFGWKEGIGPHPNLFYLTDVKKCQEFNNRMEKKYK